MAEAVAREGEGAAVHPAGAARAAVAAGAGGEVERLRRSIVHTRAKICALEGRGRLGPLPRPAAAKLTDLRREAEMLWQELRRVLHEEVPSSDGP